MFVASLSLSLLVLLHAWHNVLGVHVVGGGDDIFFRAVFSLC